jgi:hypothetical protein
MRAHKLYDVPISHGEVFEMWTVPDSIVMHNNKKDYSCIVTGRGKCGSSYTLQNNAAWLPSAAQQASNTPKDIAYMWAPTTSKTHFSRIA